METPKSITAAAGGMGAVVDEAELRHVRRDIRDVQRAIKRRWITPDEAPAALGEEMLAIVRKRVALVADEKGNVNEIDNARAQVAAAGVLLEMEAQNQKDDHLAYATENASIGDEGGSSTVRVIVERVSRNALIPGGDGHAPALPRGPAEDDRPRATIQRGDVRTQVGQDNDGRVSGV